MQTLLHSELKRQFAQLTKQLNSVTLYFRTMPFTPPQMMLSSAASSVPPHQQFAPFHWPHHPQTLQQQQSMAPQAHEQQQLRAVSSEDVRFGAGAFSDGEAERSTRRRGAGGN